MNSRNIAFKRLMLAGAAVPFLFVEELVLAQNNEECRWPPPMECPPPPPPGPGFDAAAASDYHRELTDYLERVRENEEAEYPDDYIDRLESYNDELGDYLADFGPE